MRSVAQLKSSGRPSPQTFAHFHSETGDVVPREDTARGYEVAKVQYLLVEDQEINAVQIESTRTIEIERRDRRIVISTHLTTLLR
jgi:non-homologous end joining protein Ku